MLDQIDNLKDFRDMARLLKLDNIVIISGRSGGEFAHRTVYEIKKKLEEVFSDCSSRIQKIYRELKEDVIKVSPVFIKNHNDGEIYAQIRTNIREKDVHIFQCFNDKNDDFQELLILNDAANRAGAKTITIYTPYLPYQRQDKKDESRVPLTAKLVFNQIINSCGNKLKRIVTADLHARQAMAHFDGPIDEITAIPSFALYVKSVLKHNQNEMAVVAPDAGAAKKARFFSKLLGLSSYCTGDKRRPEHGKAEIVSIVGEVKDKWCYLIDDMIDSGGTLIEIARALKKRGAKGVYAFATHGLFSPSFDKSTGLLLPGEEKMKKAIFEEKVLNRVITTDSIPPKYQNYYENCADWLDVISLSKFYADVFLCNQLAISYSSKIENYLDYIKRPDATIKILNK